MICIKQHSSLVILCTLLLLPVVFNAQSPHNVNIAIGRDTVFHQDADSTSFKNQRMNWGEANSNSPTGDFSTTWGRQNIASENQATSWGRENEAASWNTTAFGYRTKALASHATSWGAATTASGIYSTASGKDNLVSGAFSMVWGSANEVSGGSSSAWGAGNTISGNGGAVWGLTNMVTGHASSSWGKSNSVSGDTSTVWGSMNRALGKHTTSWGNQNHSEGHYATMWGRNLWSQSYLSTVIGKHNVIREETQSDWKDSESLFQIGNGNEDERNDAFLVLKNGNIGVNVPFDSQLPSEKLEVNGNIKSSQKILTRDLLVSEHVGIGETQPKEELVISNSQDTSHLVVKSANNLSLIDLKGLNQSALRFFEGEDEMAQIKWNGARLEVFSKPPTSFPNIRFPVLKMTADNKLAVNPGITTPTEVLEVGGRLKIANSNAAATPGVIRYNSTNMYFEGYNGIKWEKFSNLPIDDDGDSYLTFKEDTNEDSLVFTVNGVEKMSFNGHTLTLGKDGNTFIGYKTAELDVNSNIGNTSLGWQSTPFLINGVSNTNLGFWTGHLAQTGDWNTNLGAYAAFNNENGSRNTMLGYYAGYNNTGNGNVFIGHMAGRNETSDNKLYIDNSDTSSPLIYGNFDLDLVHINGSLYLPSLRPAQVITQNLAIDERGKVIALPMTSNLEFYSGDFHDWIGNVGNNEIAVGLNNFLENGKTLNSLTAKVIPFNQITQQTMNIKLLARNLSNGQYLTLLQVSDNNIPSTATTYTDIATTAIVVNKDNFEYLLVSENSASQILKVTLE